MNRPVRTFASNCNQIVNETEWPSIAGKGQHIFSGLLAALRQHESAFIAEAGQHDAAASFGQDAFDVAPPITENGAAACQCSHTRLPRRNGVGHAGRFHYETGGCELLPQQPGSSEPAAFRQSLGRKTGHPLSLCPFTLSGCHCCTGQSLAFRTGGSRW